MPEQLRRIDDLRIGTVTICARPATLSADRDTDSRGFLVVHLTSGRGVLRRGDTAVVLEDRDLLVLTESAAPVTIVGSAEVVIVRIPERAAGPYLQSMRAADARVVGRGDGIARVAGSLLAEVSTWEPADLMRNPSRLAQHMVGLIGLMCADGNASDARTGLLEAAKQYIEARLGDLDLSPDSIARAQNVSTRTLHRLFEAEGMTISSWIRTRRLESCRVELADAQLASIPVSVVGARWGLWDAAHFSRLFKSTYGLAPSAFRARALESARDRQVVRELPLPVHERRSA